MLPGLDHRRVAHGDARAYGGGSLRVGLIDRQITRTLEQFPSVGQVRIAIEGETAGVLEP
jgi:hypothetical protein